MAGGKPLAFSDAHAAGLCSLAYLPAAAGSGGSVALVTAGPDGKLCFRSADAPAEVQKEVQVANGGAPTPLHCLAAAAGKPVVTGDDANFVKVCKRGTEARDRMPLPAAGCNAAWSPAVQAACMRQRSLVVVASGGLLLLPRASSEAAHMAQLLLCSCSTPAAVLHTPGWRDGGGGHTLHTAGRQPRFSTKPPACPCLQLASATKPHCCAVRGICVPA